MTALLVGVLLMQLFAPMVVSAEEAGTIAEEQSAVSIPEDGAGGGSISVSQILWPDENGAYAYTLTGATPGAQYMLLEIPGVYTSLDAVSLISFLESGNVLYLTQEEADSTALTFTGLIPSEREDVTVIITGGDTPVIGGYILNICKLESHT